MQYYSKKTAIPSSAEELYRWHACGGAFERLMPPWESLSVLRWKGGEKTEQLPIEQQWGDISKGSEITISLKQGPLRLSWRAEHIASEEGKSFVDRQLSGPFSYWEHEHIFVATDSGQSQLEDRLQYRLPLSPFSNIARPWVEQKIKKMFAFRHERTCHDLRIHEQYRSLPRLRIAITGASGLIGRNLIAFLKGGGHQVFSMVRKRAEAKANEIPWSVQGFDPSPLEGMDAVIHLAGEPILGRWTKHKKEKIMKSRVEGTSCLAKALTQLKNPPKVFLSASAIGFYGNREEICSESTRVGEGFLADVCRQWEEAAEPARRHGIRVVSPRIGIVLSGAGGALNTMLTPFSLGLGGRVGNGLQWMSWISLDDLLSMFLFALYDDELEGPLNCTAPEPVRNKEFTRTLGEVLHRPTIFPLPALAVRVLGGEMGQALLLDGAKVVPEKAQARGFEWSYPNLKKSLSLEVGALTE